MSSRPCNYSNEFAPCMEGLRLGAPLAQTGRVMGMRNPQGPPIDPPGSLMCRCVALACLLALARSPAILVKWDWDLNLNADLSRASHARASLCGCSGTLERCAAAPAARSGRHSLRVLPPLHRSTLEVMREKVGFIENTAMRHRRGG